MQKILHLINDYAGSQVYQQLISNLDHIGLHQKVYTGIRRNELIGRNNIVFKSSAEEIMYSVILNNHIDRFFYKRKIYKISQDVKSKVDIDDATIIHAHTWFSDGGVAYKLSKETGKPFVITVRNTDLNIFYKYMFHLRSYGFKILKAAERIVFISEAYFRRFEAIVGDDQYGLLTKSVIIHNGVDNFWLENAGVKVRLKKAIPFNLLYVGRFTKGKNLINLIKAVILLNKHRHTVSLNLVGGGGNDEQNVISLIEQTSHVNYKGEIKDKQKLLNIYKNNDIFVMPSRGETFGLVYVEALLQGLPILYTHNEGIDGVYSGVGEAVSNFHAEEIANKLKTLIDNYDSYMFDISTIQANHNWGTIANRYIKLYQEIQ